MFLTEDNKILSVVPQKMRGGCFCVCDDDIMITAVGAGQNFAKVLIFGCVQSIIFLM